jgi:dethiobiotin synthase
VTRDLFVTGTDTNVGKTLLSALLVAALNRAYWKPIQTGSSEGIDRDTVLRLAELPTTQAFPESYVFEPPVSPHLAASLAGTVIELSRIRRPMSKQPLIVEGAGGLLVPINDDAFMTDLIRHLDLPVIIATRSTLGTINHTLLTLLAARNANLEILGVVMLGNENVENCRAIERYGKVPVIGCIPTLDVINRSTLLRVFEHHFDQTVFV